VRTTVHRKDVNSTIIFSLDATFVLKTSSFLEVEKQLFVEGVRSWTERAGSNPMWRQSSGKPIGGSELKTLGFSVLILAISDVSSSVAGSFGIEVKMQFNSMFQDFGTRTFSDVMGYADQGEGKAYICYLFYHHGNGRR